MGKIKKLVHIVTDHMSRPTMIVGLILFTFTALFSFESSESIPGFIFIWFILLGAFSIRATIDLQKWLLECNANFFRKRNLFIFLGLLIADIVFLVYAFSSASGETVYYTKFLDIASEIVLSTGVVLLMTIVMPLITLVIYLSGHSPLVPRATIKIPTKKLVLIPVALVVILVGGFFMAWGFYNTQEFISGIYWDKYFCGPSKIEAATDGVVRIETDNGSGTGFWIDKDLVLTNNHVVIFENNIEVVHHGTRFPADVVQTDTVRDIAILRIMHTTDYDDNSDHRILKWRSRWPVLAEEVFVLGFPEGTKDITATKGIVSSLTSDKFDNTKYIQTDAAINPGNSGGPLVDGCGKALGISSSTLLDAENIGFAIQISRIEDELRQMIIAGKNISSEELKHGQTGGEAEVVAKYYVTVSQGEFEDAYDFYSKDLQSRVLFKGWKESYKNTFAIRFKSAKRTSAGTVEVSFKTLDYPNDEKEDYIEREFEGTWSLVKENGLWKLNYSNIREVELGDEYDVSFTF